MSDEFLFLPHEALLDYMTDQWRREQEDKPLNVNSKLTTALNKTPAVWINAACDVLGLDTKALRRRKAKIQALVEHLTDPEKLAAVVEGLPPEAREALRMIVDAGGWMKVGALHRRFGDCTGDGWFWDERPPTSVLGQLRHRALLFIGRAPIGSRTYRVAVVPKELRPLLQEILSAIPPVPQPAAPTREEVLEGVLEEIRSYYEDQIDWEPLVRRADVEAFIRDVAHRARRPEQIFRAWEGLAPFIFFMDYDRDEHPTLDEIKPYHLSEWVHFFIPRKFLFKWKLKDLRRMLSTVAEFYAFLARTGRGVSPETAEMVDQAVKELTAPKRELGVIHRPAPKGGERILQVFSPQHGVITYTINDYWLAIVCYVEYDGDWERFRQAAAQVVDGPAKQERIDFILSHDPRTMNVLFREGVLVEGVEEALDWFYHQPLRTEKAW